MPDITKILIANRGEVAVRIIRACSDMGIKSIAVYSDADRNALHVRCADEAYYLGPAPPADSYLRIDTIIAAAKISGADAIHPGYGFLAECADFAQACCDAGITFIGPRPAAIAAMGNKAAARATAVRAGVPVLSGTNGSSLLSDKEISAIAPYIGYPLLVKPSAGGGGKGMREVHAHADLPAALVSARREAASAFGDGSVYLEKMVVGARHIEIQVMADAHGNIVHLGERECSIQRRHQKVIEEAPSPFLNGDAALRRRMGKMACTVATAAGYTGAGTIEFLVDEGKNFYFLEMNTRLQVEHPVTEMVTGVDIVKEQIRIAQGHALSFKQEDVVVSGWAIECRINAEDPYNNFFPSPGLVTNLTLPCAPGVRVDNGVCEGYAVPHYYDSLLAKVICWGESRHAALARMRRALEECRISGVKTNIPLHRSVLDSSQFQAGAFNTCFLTEHCKTENKQEQFPETETDWQYCCI